VFARIVKFFRRKKFYFDPQAPTIAQAFDYSDENFVNLANELINFLPIGNSLIALDDYIKGPLFTKYQLNLNDPRHSAILGYAFCSAILIKRSSLTKELAQKTLEYFYPNEPVIPIKQRTVI
jgi:hypothetical protein